METLLEEQEALLDRLVILLEEERDVLIHEDGNRLRELVALKENLQADLERSEVKRKESWGEATLMQMVSRLNEERAKRLQHMGESVKERMKKIKALQETNMMLTRQSADYSQRLMDILQQTLRKSGITYGKKGAVETGQGVTASMDRSV